MEFIVISHPEFFPKEDELITLLFENGLMRFHLRKPFSTQQEMEELLRRIAPEYYPRIALHDHHGLAMRLSLGGVHLNGRNPCPPEGYTGRISCSCHSVEEVESRKNEADYLFLSPVFDSVSKQGYRSAYTEDALKKASEKEIIDRKVIALGGVTPQRIPFLHRLGFGGIAVLGIIWQDLSEKGVHTSFSALKEALCLDNKQKE